MATAKGVEITNLDATPRTTLEAASGGGKMRVFMDTIAAGTGDIDDNDIILLAELPSNAKISSIMLYSDDLDSGGSPSLTWNVGLYNGQTKFNDTDSSATAYAAGAVLDEDCYASAVSGSAAITGTECAFEARNINAIANFIWEDGGLSSDPKVPLRVGLTVQAAAATAAAGDITLVVTYIVD
jgi:hypothetical protein